MKRKDTEFVEEKIGRRSIRVLNKEINLIVNSFFFGK